LIERWKAHGLKIVAPDVVHHSRVVLDADRREDAAAMK